jgi:hypothetical protein
MRFKAIASAMFLLLAGVARADESFQVTGQTQGRPCSGTVTVCERDGQLEVALATDQGGHWVGRGQRDGTTVRAQVQQSAGAADVIGNLGQQVETGPPLTLIFDQTEQRWHVQLTGPQGTVVDAIGDASAGAAPTTTLSGGADRWHEFQGVPFVKGAGDDRGVHITDPKQGSLCDCFLVSSLIAVARTNPGQIYSMIDEVGGGEYDVTLRGAGRFLWMSDDKRMRVDRRFPVSGESTTPAYAKTADTEERNGVTYYELWPMMIERAIAQHVGGYDVLNKGGFPADIIGYMGGTTRTHGAGGMSEAAIDRVLGDALRANKPVVFVFPKNLGQAGMDAHIVGWHCYVLSATRDGGWVLYNPWQGSHPPRPLTAAQLKALGATINVGSFE